MIIFFSKNIWGNRSQISFKRNNIRKINLDDSMTEIELSYFISISLCLTSVNFILFNFI